MATQAEKFQEIADAIKAKTGKSNKIVANNFATEIMSIDRLRPMTLYPNGLDNGFYGNMAARVAGTYHLARITGKDIFDYVQYHGNVLNTNQTSSSTNYGKAKVRDEYGRGVIDCSAYVGLILRGIPYDKSPFATYKNADAMWLPKNDLSQMYGNEGWEYRIIDQQPAGVYRDFAIKGYSSLRTAADIGEFFYKYGYVVFDKERDGAPTDSLVNALQPGDLIFFSSGSSSKQSRFRVITHIAMVAERTDKYFHVTGSDPQEGETNEDNELTVLYSDFIDEENNRKRFNTICLICRPDYRKSNFSTQIPIGVNLLGYPWLFDLTKYTSNGITLKVTQTEGVLQLSGTATSTPITIPMKYLLNDQYRRLCLPAGKYQLSGMEQTGVNDNSVALQVIKLNSEGKEEVITQSYGTTVGTFELTEDTYIAVRLRISNINSLNCKITPSLVRLPEVLDGSEQTSILAAGKLNSIILGKGE